MGEALESYSTKKEEKKKYYIPRTSLGEKGKDWLSDQT